MAPPSGQFPQHPRQFKESAMLGGIETCVGVAKQAICYKLVMGGNKRPVDDAEEEEMMHGA